MIRNFLTISAFLLIAIFFCWQAAAATIVTTSGEEMVINRNTTKESNITVLNFAADGTVTRLYQNKLGRDNREEPRRDYQITTPEDRGDLMIFQVGTLPGHKKDTACIRVYSTRRSINLLAEVKSHGNYEVMDPTEFAFTKIARLLASIPPRQRAEDTAVYQIYNPRL